MCKIKVSFDGSELQWESLSLIRWIKENNCLFGCSERGKRKENNTCYMILCFKLFSFPTHNQLK